MFEPEQAMGHSLVNSRVKCALMALLNARQYALDSGRNVWDFAISFRQLRALRLSRNDFRWLVCKRWIVAIECHCEFECNRGEFSGQGLGCTYRMYGWKRAVD